MAAGRTALKVYVRGTIVDREDARVSVFDASFQSGDQVWEGLRLYHGAVFRLSAHLERLEHSAKILYIALPLDGRGIARAVYETLAANGFAHSVHIRLMVSRGERSTSGMDPRTAPPAGHLYIIAEEKPVAERPAAQRLRTTYVRRPSADVLDPSIHHANQLNSILARLQVLGSGADAALMLDAQGFVAETDTANIFCVHGRRVLTPLPVACLHGITRGIVIEEAKHLGFSVEERSLSLAEFYSADEVFTTGTVQELVPIVAIDDRVVGTGQPGTVWERLLLEYRTLVSKETSAAVPRESHA
jgi:branched-chain amino acid aminotransferase